MTIKIWNDELLKAFYDEIIMTRRDKYTQMLRDAALGHPEFGDETYVFTREKCTQHAADALRYSIDADVLRSFSNGK